VKKRGIRGCHGQQNASKGIGIGGFQGGMLVGKATYVIIGSKIQKFLLSSKNDEDDHNGTTGDVAIYAMTQHKVPVIFLLPYHCHQQVLF